MSHDHDQRRDPFTQKIYIGCNCFCAECYVPEGTENPCVCVECFCGREDRSLRRLSEKYYREDAEPARRRVENVVKDLPEVLPDKTGQCRKCNGPTYRKGTRGRFPVTCEGCK